MVGVWDLTPGVNEGEPSVEDGERKRKRRKQAPGTVITKVRSFVLLSFPSTASFSPFLGTWTDSVHVLVVASLGPAGTRGQSVESDIRSRGPVKSL
jgi:hypothetical protein